jgi:hypothetical protein
MISIFVCCFSSPVSLGTIPHTYAMVSTILNLYFLLKFPKCVCVGVGVGVCVCVCQLTEFENDGSFEMFLLVESNVFILLKLVSQFASFYTYEM